MSTKFTIICPECGKMMFVTASEEEKVCEGCKSHLICSWDSPKKTIVPKNQLSIEAI